MERAIQFCCCEFKLACNVRSGGNQYLDEREWDPAPTGDNAYDRLWSNQAMDAVRRGAKPAPQNCVVIPIVMGGPLPNLEWAGYHNYGAIHLGGDRSNLLVHELGHFLGYEGNHPTDEKHSKDPGNVMIQGGETGGLTDESRPDKQWCERLDQIGSQK